MKALNQKKGFSAIVSMLMTLAVCHSVSVQASDIEIYSNAKGSKAHIMLMLDTSGSMGISSLVLPKTNQYGSPGDVDISLCSQIGVVETGDSTAIKQWAYNAIDLRIGSETLNKTSFKKQVIINGQTISYYLRGCGNPTIDASGKLQESSTGKFDRLSRLKDALIQLLADSSISDSTYMGLGHFSAKTPLTIGTTSNKLVDGHSGRILVPAVQLTAVQREKLIRQLVSLESVDTTTDENGSPNTNLKLSSTTYPDIFKASSGTPTAHAYAEVAAYMMGTTTGQDLNLPARSTILYDGYSIMQKSDDVNKQVYYMCVSLGSGEHPEALGATVMACDNEWNKSDSDWYDSSNKSMGSGIKIYRPKEAADSDPDGDGWIPVSASELYKKVGVMNSLWETHEKLPVGWRYGGWMKLAHEPMDIEPIGGKVWGNKGAWNLVSYRSSPFSIKTGTTTETITTQGFQNCPVGYSVLSIWNSLCTKSGNWSRDATQNEQNNRSCVTPADGSKDPLPNARNPQGAFWTENYNRKNTVYNNRKCTQTISAVIRPWGDVTQTVSISAPVDNNYGGFAYSAADTKNGNNYLAGGSTNTCDGNGIYFLTDGAPNSTKDTMAQTIMNTSLKNGKNAFTSKPSGTGVLVSPILNSGLFTGETGGWEYIGEYSKKLLDPAQNPGNMKIKTAVVGFGSSFAGIPKNEDGTYNCEVVKDTNKDAYNACKWGGADFGDGGFYYAENSDDIKKSIVNFVQNVTPEFSPITTGSPTLPQDALNPLRIQPYGYYASFTPKPQESTQLWVGNMNKYHIFKGQLYDTSKTISLIKTDGSLDSSANGIWENGVEGQLPLRFGLNANNEQIANRTILTNREITGTSAVEINSLKQVNVKTLFDTGADALFANDSKKNYWLNLLGYNVGATETVTLSDLAAKPELRQVGATMHSTPILLTQRGKITDTLDTTDRDDYLLFGSTQGLLHVVDAGTGVEKFAFVPNEMMENQPAAFLPENSSTGGSANLFYGVDAPWTAHTQYVSKTDGTLTVNSSGRTSDGGTNTDLMLTGSQWVYGGLRMGGRSYYALDLSDLNTPSLKFHIDPEHAQIYRANAATSTGVAALSYMGKSWSKPTLAYVKFGGVKKLVMFVGGGYDVGYEDAAYDQNTTTGGGAGVYMFDAATGDLLWWSSANATSAKNAEAFTDASASTINMKYSVVSQINAIDRDDDGLVDHLYFGDLGGQAFRVDLNNNATGADATAKKENFVTHVVRLLNEHTSAGASPRFYEMPSFSIHEDNGYVAAVAFSSGNRSSPLSGVSGTNQFGSTTSAADGVFVVYDKDVAKYNLYDSSTSVKSDAKLISLNENIGTGVAIADHGGWKYIYSEKAGVYKGMNELYALDGMLYVNVFHRDGTGIGSDCGAGVKGDSYIYQFCLPTGKCTFATTAVGVPNHVKIGAGILGSGLGQESGSDTTSLVVPRPELDCTTDVNKNKPECQQFNTTAKLRQLRWYETR